jgi:Tfp pilus assembly protein FimT
MRTADSGLTVIELVVTASILGIVLALSFSAAGVIDNRRLAAAGRALATEIRYAQERARAERHCWRVRFYTEGERYGLEVLEGETAGPGGGCIPGRTGRWREQRSVTLTRPLDLVRTTFPDDSLILSPFGGASEGTAWLGTPGGMRRAVSVGAQGSVTVGRALRTADP